MKTPFLLGTLGAVVALGAFSNTNAAPTVRRLTPPSALFSMGDAAPPYISRFLPGQRFDVQATITPDAGQTITAATLAIDGVAIEGSITSAPANASGLPPGSIAVTLRAISVENSGVHTLSITATQSNGDVVTANGNFEVIPLKPTGLAAKNIIIMIGDGMGIAHRTAARIMKNGVALGKANAPLAMDTFPFTGIINTHSLNSIVTDSS